MAFTAHQLAKMILDRPDVTLDEASGQGLGHKQPVTMEDGCRVWLKFYPPAHAKGAAAPAKAPEAVAAAIAPRVKRSKAPEAAPAPATAKPAPAAPVVAKASEKAPQTELEAMKASQAAMEAKLNALMKALGV